MGLPNLRLRGGNYHWRRKITVAGTPVPLCLSLRTGHFARARAISDHLGVAVEGLRVAYGQFTGMSPQQLKRVFSDALRWQLRRIEQDQAGSAAASGDHATTNSLYAEAWDFLGRAGVEAKWNLDEHARLIAAGWNPAQAKIIADIVFDLQTGGAVSGGQIQTYSEAFEIPVTRDNVVRIKQMICKARAAACREATARLSVGGDNVAAWIDDAIADGAPFAFEGIPQAAPPTTPISAAKADPVAESDAPACPRPSCPKKRLTEAGEECIAAHQKEGAWDTDTIKQVRTAVRLFDYACGVDVLIEDLEQPHVKAFTDLCKAIPNRWGRTREEQAGGIGASLERAAIMATGDIGIGQETINKHITWIEAVLNHAAGEEDGENSHRPQKPLLFKAARAGIGKGSRKVRKRKRDKRANWSKQEVARLLSAPVWTGAAGIDDRLKPGPEIIHDAWYWLPLMLPLYGGRSSELVGLALSEVHEADAIPYFLIEYTEDRPLKNVQSIRKLPIHPELIRLGFIEYVAQIREAGCAMLFPEMHSPEAASFASTFYKSIFTKLRNWAFPGGTQWRHRVGGAWKDKDVHSYRGLATTLLKGRVPDSLRCDIFGHEGETETASTYDEEAELELKLEALRLLTPLTAQIEASLPIRIRPPERLRHGTPRSRPRLRRQPLE